MKKDYTPTVNGIRSCIEDTLDTELSRRGVKRLTKQTIQRLQEEIEKAVHRVLPIGVEIEGRPHIFKKDLKLCVDWPIRFHSIGAQEKLRFQVERAGMELEIEDKTERDAWDFLTELKRL